MDWCSVLSTCVAIWDCNTHGRSRVIKKWNQAQEESKQRSSSWIGAIKNPHFGTGAEQATRCSLEKYFLRFSDIPNSLNCQIHFWQCFCLECIFGGKLNSWKKKMKWKNKCLNMYWTSIANRHLLNKLKHHNLIKLYLPLRALRCSLSRLWSCLWDGLGEEPDSYIETIRNIQKKLYNNKWANGKNDNSNIFKHW